MHRVKMKLPGEMASSVVPSGSAKKRKRLLPGILAAIALLLYVVLAYHRVGPTQPALWQRLVALGCAALALITYLLFTRSEEGESDELLQRTRLAQRSDFGKHKIEEQWAKQRHIVLKLPLVGETSLRLLGGILVFGLTIVWWLTPLAPVRVRPSMIDDLTVPLGEEIASPMLLAPNGRIAVVGPPIVPRRACELAKRIKENSGAYQLGLKAIAEGRYGEARTALSAAASDGAADPVQVQIARAQNEMYAGLSTDAARLFEEVVRQKPDNPMIMLQAAAAWLHGGAVDSAEPLIARAMKLCQEKPKEKAPLSHCLHALATLRVVQGKQFGEAETLCMRARDLTENSTEQGLSLLAASLNNEAVVYLLTGKYPGAVNRFEEARYNWVKAFGPTSPLVAADLGNQAPLRVMLGDYDKADEALAQAESICRDFLPKDHPFVALTQTGRALVAEALGRYAEGLLRARDAQAVLAKSLGPTDPTNVPILDVLSLLYADQGQYNKAQDACQRAIEIGRRAWGSQHLFYAQILSRRAQIDVLQKDYTGAETFCRQGSEIVRQSLGKNCPEMATLLNTWGWLEFERDRVSEARTYFDKALKIREDVFGRKNLDVARTLGSIAALENSPETIANGEAGYTRAIKICEGLVGREHPEVARLLRGRALLLVREEKFTEAVADLDRVLAIQKKALTASHPELAATLDAYATVLRAMTPPDSERADEMESQAKSTREKHEQEDGAE